jgi:lipid A 3-O-deacylase
MKTRRLLHFLLAPLFACAGNGAQAADLMPSGGFIAEGGVTQHGAYSVTAGVYWPWKWKRVSYNGEWTGMTEVFASHWSARVPQGREGLTQVGVIPVVRYRFDHGSSAWFADGGIGLSYTDRVYRTQTKTFSTRFNFIDVIGAGRSFGSQREHEVSLRLSHVSNAGIKEPNPGENFLQLRYARSF